ncbi:hypothetical protein KIN20_008236 [Parelaphostrongylus tenuis]|uniref:Uncharacterized protein n=1 Tax=Parelaphostrongylus tenuis TaxID=148309 RepID=A0AAD5MWJ4_PARTN|nr:hypothetical protein KIN20_008236 [Parelaphostrongylus tenuis]
MMTLSKFPESAESTALQLMTRAEKDFPEEVARKTFQRCAHTHMFPPNKKISTVKPLHNGQN